VKYSLKITKSTANTDYIKKADGVLLAIHNDSINDDAPELSTDDKREMIISAKIETKGHKI
jgi:hypothetical protein